MGALMFLIVFSWFAGLQMGLTWGTGALRWIWRKLTKRIVRREIRTTIRDSA